MWQDYRFTQQENQDKIWLPLNPISEKVFYTNIDQNEKKNQRVIVSALLENPIAWQISKVETTNPLGLMELTLYQDVFNPNTDYVNLETGEMYADYYDNNIEPIIDIPPVSDVYCQLSCNTQNIKVGGSYKLLTLNVFDKNNIDLTEQYLSQISMDSWSVTIDDSDITNSGLVILKEQPQSNKIRIKFNGDKTYLTKILNITCRIDDSISATVQLEISAL